VNKWISKRKTITVQALGVPGQLVHEGGVFISPTHRPLLRISRYSWYSLLGHNAVRRILL